MSRCCCCCVLTSAVRWCARNAAAARENVRSSATRSSNAMWNASNFVTAVCTSANARSVFCLCLCVWLLFFLCHLRIFLPHDDDWTLILCPLSRTTQVSQCQNVYILHFIDAKDDGGCGDNWSYMTCKAPVKSSPPTNNPPAFYRPDALSVASQTN